MAKDAAGVEVDPLSGKPVWALSRRERRRAARAAAGLPPPRRRWPWVLLALVVAVAAAGWWQREMLGARLAAWREAREAARVAAEAEAAPVAPGAMQVNRSEWAVVEPVALRRTVKVIGALRPSRRAEIAAETGGQVEAVVAREGDRVPAGALLVQVDVEGLALELRLAESNAEATRSDLALAEGQLARQRELSERGVSASAALDEAEGGVARLRAQLAAQEDQVASARRAREGATVTAPFAGVIASRSVETGNVVAPGTPLMTLVDLSRMEMLARAPVAAGAALRVGQRVELRVDGIAGATFEGVVDRIAPVAEEGTRALTVYVMVGNEGGTLLGGMFATGEVVTAEAASVIAVPPEAVREEGGPHLLVVEDGVLARRDVVVGESWGALVAVEGVEAGARVVTAALPELREGEPVELVEF